ncbi:hypothetical protein RG47T_3182 [Mucilaginibacter polytrichastri]|uniref:Uncharacterized protein n=1 Tax=Mucilaginibacter polytrichastri TaxID=1302689 RepID=A0A1Q6A125_9SPHI|nr:hypothetical protein RG47T_3182 [Mucilaginibacter polytrichastri]
MSVKKFITKKAKGKAVMVKFALVANKPLFTHYYELDFNKR